MISSSSAPVVTRAAEQQQEPEERSDKQAESLLMKDRPRPLRYQGRAILLAEANLGKIQWFEK